MDEQLKPEISRIYIFNDALKCTHCEHDVFLPYEMYANVEKPGIKCIFVQYCAICQQCGFVLEFNDPSFYDSEKDNYIWALDQEYLYPREPEPPVIPTLDDETKATQIRCIGLILNFLISKDRLSNDFSLLFQQQQYSEITLKINPNAEIRFEHMVTFHCLTQLTSELANYHYSLNQLIVNVLSENDSTLKKYERFLLDHLK